uniref:Uncharacterized protein n=1 Tax=Globodera rostochiensis TaxID=31243 RepID=A0A914HXT7_GLORO
MNDRGQISYRLISQSVQIFDLNFSENCILPNQPNFKGEGRVTINDIDANYLRNQTAELSVDGNKTNQSVSTLMSGWNDLVKSSHGCLVVDVPKECLCQIRDQLVVLLHIDIIVCRPKQGIKFVLVKDDFDQNDDELPSGMAALF